MDDFVLSAAERRFLSELEARAVPYMVVGLSAAALQGANLTTVDIDLWFPTLDHPQLDAAARAAGGFLVSGFGVMPPMLGGPLSDRFDIVTHMSGLGSFAEEAAHARRVTVDQVELSVLALSRIVVSKRAAGRPKDLAVLPALEEALMAVDEGQPGGR